MVHGGLHALVDVNFSFSVVVANGLFRRLSLNKEISLDNSLSLSRSPSRDSNGHLSQNTYFVLIVVGFGTAILS